LKDVGGLAETKRTLISIMQLFRGGGALIGHTRFDPPKGILLTGQSGTGKTLLARALAGRALLRWFPGLYFLSRASEVVPSTQAFSLACANGHLRVAEWLYDTFDITGADVCARGTGAFWFACMYGHLAVAQWLAASFALTAADAHAQQDRAYREASGNHCRGVVAWLTATFGPPVQAQYTAYEGMDLVD